MSDSVQVIAAVIKREKQYLVCQRPWHKRHGGLWEFPGGKVESGESLHEAATRELLEELGMRVVGIGATLLSSVEDSSCFTINFVEVDATGEPILLEHAAYRWATVGELESLDLAPVDGKFVLQLSSSKSEKINDVLG